jgi:Protein of unknown function (DUF3634)
MDLLIKLAILAFAALAFWAAIRPRRAFVVQVKWGMPRAVRGVVTPAFLDQVRRVCDEGGVQSATVSGLVRGRRIMLAFSGSIPPGGQQQLRNWWAMSGWSARPAKDK